MRYKIIVEVEHTAPPEHSNSEELNSLMKGIVLGTVIRLVGGYGHLIKDADIAAKLGTAEVVRFDLKEAKP